MSSGRTLAVRIAVAAAVFAGHPCLGEMIVQEDEQIQVGRIIAESPSSLRLLTGSASGATEIIIRREEVEKRLRGEDELSCIRECLNTTELGRWTTGYYFAGLEDTADRCLNRLLELDASLSAEPKMVGAEAFRAYWNRAILQRRVTGEDQQNSVPLLRAARWARKAGLEEEARDFLRRAYTVDPESLEIPPLAAEWRVRLDPWLRLDLTPALRWSLVSEAIQDEGLEVSPRKNMRFLTLSLIYDYSPKARTLTRNSFQGSDMQGFYGFRPIWLRGGAPYLDPRQESEMVYERLETRRSQRPVVDQAAPVAEDAQEPSGAFEIVGRNIFGPRKIDEAGETRSEPGERSRALEATRWLAIIVEIPQSQRTFTLEWGDGVRDEIDLDFLDLVRQPLSALSHEAEGGRVAPTMVPPAIGAILGRLSSPSTATACLALDRLARFFEELGGAAVPAWMATVDGAVLEAGTRQEEDIRTAAWSYFVQRPNLSEVTLAYFGRQPRYVQKQWIELIEREIEGRIPTSAPAYGASPTTQQSRAATLIGGTESLSKAALLLGAALRSHNETVCNAALDGLMHLGDRVDWGMAENASETAHILALSRLDRLADQAAAERLLRAIMKDIRPATAAGIAAHARRLQISMASPADPLLLQWAQTTENDVEERLMLLRVLEAVDMGELVYSEPFADLLHAATDERGYASVREAAYTLVVRQAEMCWSKKAQARLSRSGTSRAPQAAEPAEFPTLVSITAQDPLLFGLTGAAQSAPHPVRIDALANLLFQGYAEEALNAVSENLRGGLGPETLLKDIVAAHPEVAYCDGLMALMGSMLRPDWAASGDYVLTYLRDAVATRVRPDYWRVFAAVKAGVDFEELNALAPLLSPVAKLTHESLLNELCHPTVQDRDRLLSQTDVAQRMAELRRIDLRRGYLVDGRYGVLAIIETTRSEGRPAIAGPKEGEMSHYRWRVPERLTIALSPVVLETDDTREGYRVLWGEQTLGEGRVKVTEGVRSPSKNSRRLEPPPELLLGTSGWGWPNPEKVNELLAPAEGPALLSVRRVPPRLSAGQMVLDGAPYLRAALRSQQVFGDEDVERLVPSPYMISLRYTAFGSYYGTGQRQALPRRETVVPGQRHLLNVMLVMERLPHASSGPATPGPATSAPTTSPAIAPTAKPSTDKSS